MFCGHRTACGTRIGGRGTGCNGPVIAARIRQQLSSRHNHNGKEDSQRNKTSRDSVIGDQMFSRRRNVNGSRPVAANHQTRDKPPTMRAEPFHCCGRGSRIAKSHADAAQHTESGQQSPVAATKACQNATAAKEQTTQRGADSRSKLVLQQTAGNHKQGERNSANCISPCRLCISQINPSLIESAHRSAGRMLSRANKIGLPDAPCIQNSEAQVDGGPCKNDDPGANRRTRFSNRVQHSTLQVNSSTMAAA